MGKEEKKRCRQPTEDHEHRPERKREKERENLMSTASRMHRSVFGTRKVGAVVAGARANASRRAPNHNQALPRNNTLNTERRGHKHLLVVTAAASEAAEAAEVESRSTLRIKLKCYSAEPLQEAVEAILLVAERTGCDKCGPAYLPTRRRKYTILKSPHVNKKSREQFEIRTHQRLIDLKNVSAQTIDGLMALDLPAGVDVEVKLQ